MEADLPEARHTFETNFFSVIHMCKTFLPLLIKAKGTIVQIGSVAGVCDLVPNYCLKEAWADLVYKIIPYVFGSVYNASKAALHSWSDALRVELAPVGYVPCPTHGFLSLCVISDNSRLQRQGDHGHHRRRSVPYCAHEAHPRSELVVCGR